jgi:hypothetical protein
MVKAIYLLRRKPELAREDFHHCWREGRGAVAARILGARRHVQCHAIMWDDGARFIDPDRTPLFFTEEVTAIG